MSLRVNLKLKLSKIIKRITVKYNTFEKATYDEYLIASLVLRSKSEDEAFKYIDEITGAGSLNPHFKRLYEDISSFSKEQLERIMENSMFPVLKIDDSNRYDYYPQLNISVFQKRIYEGDIAERKNLAELLYIKEEIIDLKVQNVKALDKPEPYYVEFANDGNIAVRLLDKNVSIPSELFESLLTIELDSIAKYKGTVHNKVDGAGWNILNNSVVNNLFSTNNFIWGWMLIPITALSEVIRHDCKDGYLALKQFNYYFIAACVILLWAVTIPLWTPFYHYAEGLENAHEIFLITIKLAPFYIAYAGCAIIDNYFVGTGHTVYNAINSLIINLGYYGIFFILYLTKAITFTMDVIILMFGFGMVVHLIISVIEERLFFRKRELKRLLAEQTNLV